MDNFTTFAHCLFVLCETSFEFEVDNFYILYANFSTKQVKRNWKLHNSDSPLLIGNIKDSDVVKEVSEPSYIHTQTKLF